MGKKGFNWKSRQVVTTIIDNSSTSKIKLDLNVEGRYDPSNEFALPSQKRRTKVKDAKPRATRILSKKHRKRLEKIVDKKKKKEQRATLLEALTSVQATPEELSKLTSIASIQTKGLKRYFLEEQSKEKPKPKRDLAILSGEVKVSSLSGVKRKQLVREVVKRSDDPNVVGFDSSSESDSSCESEPEVKKVKVSDEPVKTVDVDVNVIEIQDERALTTKEVAEIVPEVSKTAPKSKTVVQRKPAVFVEVDRTEEIQKARLKLPILAEEQQIMEVINENSVIIIAGETGSGKTTQVPQFLYEAGYALEKQICVTEPRRVAAVSMSQRVAEEMNLSAREVSYLIRFEGNATEDTKIKFVTDGVLLKEVQSDFLLRKYSVVILDEAHERSVYTDILIGLLSRIVPLRCKRNDPLKLIVMSATLRLEDFTQNTRLFKTCPPVLKVDTRQFPVTVHFNKRTNDDYLKEAFNKTVKLHSQLPEGGVLVFVTGQQEVNALVRKLRKAFPLRRESKASRTEEDADTYDDDEDLKRVLRRRKKTKVVPKIDLDDYSVPGDNEIESGDESSDVEGDEEVVVAQANAQPLWVLPLYSLLPSHEQAKVFKAPPTGCRLCVVSTNVAETSLTIPNVKYVVDTGKMKVKLYDKVTGVTSYVVAWTSKASADQRAGRAGRLGPGHCYRLYSSAVFNDTFPDFSVPEIQRKPVDDLYLQMKCMNIDRIVNFPFPTAPDMLQLRSAETRLTILGALEDSKPTPLGRAIARFPVLPRYGKMLALSHQQDLLPYTICLVAALSVQEVLLETPIVARSAEEVKGVRGRWAALRRRWAGVGHSLLLGDNMVLLRAVGAAEYANARGTSLEKFCEQNGLRHKAIVEIRKLRLQLTGEVRVNVPDADVVVDPKLEPPTDLQAKLLRQILLAGMGDQIAKKISPDEIADGEDRSKYKYAYRANDMDEPVFLHSGSVLRRTPPEYVVYQEIYETNKMYMRGVSAVEPDWLPVYVPSLCNMREPSTGQEPEYDASSGTVRCMVTGTFGAQAWSLGNVTVEHPDGVYAYRWFARFFLEGKVFETLKRYGGSLLTGASAMVKSWAGLQPRTNAFLRGLMARRVRTKEALREAWTEDPKYLLSEYLLWLPQSAHNEVRLLWPPLD